MTPKRIALLGSTGSIGTQALQLIDHHRDRFEVACLVANRSAEPLLEQCRRYQPRAACLVRGGLDAGDLPEGVAATTQGADGVLEALDASQPDLVLNGITGAAGLPASEWTVRRGLPLALANKESLVMAGPYLTGLARESGAPILPVDSEHCAIFQCLRNEPRQAIRRLWITGSGGPFRTRDVATFSTITPAEALRHPTWSMGPRITVGSATMMNKAFEIVEAHWLFGVAPEQIEVLIHPQSIVHSIVEFVDGNMLAQLGAPDMRVPILYCMAYPERVPFGGDGFEPFDPVKFQQLTFDAVESDRYPAIDLAYRTLAMGGDSGTVLNAADEVLTERFLAGDLAFPAITQTVAQVLANHSPHPVESLQQVLDVDRAARDLALTAAANPSTHS